jgi:hypothetical protein
LEAWTDDFADAFPDGPFGDGVVDRDVVCDVIAEIGVDPDRFAVAVYDDAIYLQPEDEVAGRWLEERPGRLREALTARGVLHRLAVLDPAKTESTEVEGVWREVLGELQLEMTRTAFDTWLRDSRLVEFADGRCIVEVRNGYARDWLQHRLLPVVERALESVVGRAVAVEFVSSPKEVE